MAIEKLPEELLMEILSWLPVKSLLRSRSVSKHWLSLIQNPSFISLHHNRLASTAQNHHCLLLRRIIGVGLVLSLIGNDDAPVHDLDISFVGLNFRALQLLGPCNGVVCLTCRGFHSTIILCNPSMREFRVLPQPPSFKDYMASLGFGFDSVTNDYKVVRFGITNPNSYNRVGQNVQIYNLSTDSWREVDVVAPNDFFCAPSSCVTWNGGFYWYGYRYGGDQAIIGFSMTREVFDEISMPEVCLLDNSSEKELFVLNGSLAFVIYPPHFSVGAYVMEECFDIWVMNESTWTKLVTIGPLVGLNRALGFRENGEFLLEGGDEQMRSYNICTGKITEYHVYDRPASSLEVLVYTESLVSVKRRIEH